MRGFIPILILAACTQTSTSTTSSGGSIGTTTAGSTSGSTTTGGSTTGGSTSGGTTGPNAQTCTPFASWCENNMLLTCTRSGMDATGYDCGTYDTVAGSSKCVSPCPTGNAAACCVYGSATATSTCNWSLSAPTAISGSSASAPKGFYCSGPNACAQTPSMRVSLSNQLDTCPPSGYDVTVELTRAMISPGQTVTLPNDAVDLYYSERTNNGKSCYQWKGSLTFTSDVPNWSVSFDATCNDGTSTFHVAGSFNGKVQ